jgi:aryl-alcohol dehydrogenase-like predicted oxidoreductase
MTVRVIPCIGVASISNISFFDTAAVYGGRQARILQLSAARYKYVLVAHTVVAPTDV